VTYEPAYRIEIGKLWAQANVMSPAEFLVYAEEAYPEIMSAHLAVAAELAATWYEESPGDESFAAVPAELPPVEQLQASLRWALSTPESEKNLDGSATRMFHDSARRTIVSNAKREGGLWAREAEPDACRFCQMLATRGAVYASDKSALNHSTGPRRSRKTLAPPKHTDDAYHDHCRCTAVMVRPGGSYTPPKYTEAYDRDYRVVIRALDKAKLPHTVGNVMRAYREMDKHN
jgi:hypothetical protein